jgi:pyruvate carboxylase
VEVQILGDGHGNLVHLFERDCSIQRRNQKVVERAPAPYLDDATRERLCEAALAIGRATNYVGAGTVEFLMDADTGAFYFIEVNPRIQVEHTVTEMVTGLDIVKAQIRIAEGGHIGATGETGIPAQADIRLSGHALQCRITTENPENNFIPDYGRISAYRGAMGFGIRVDGGTAYSGAVVTRFYDRCSRRSPPGPRPPRRRSAAWTALMEFRIRGVATNLAFLHNLVSHPRFIANDYTTRFIDETPALFDFRKRKDRATKLLGWIADVTVNGHPETRGRAAAGPRPPTRGAALRHRGPARHPPAPRRARPHQVRRVDAQREARAHHRHHHARRPPVAAGHPHAHRDIVGVAEAYCAACPSCCRWNAGAAPPSTWRCASSTKTRGSAWR